MKKILTFFVIAVFLSVGETVPTRWGIVLAAAPSKPVALVIGNKQYQYGVLKNTVNDATDIARVLKEIGFEVILKTNLNQRAMDDALRLFGRRLSESNSVGFFYFSGHGARVAGENYLLPIDNNRIQDERDLQYYAIPASKVLDIMQSARNELNIMVLDACRDNPYRSVGKSINRGLTRMGIEKGSIIAFATALGKTASDTSKNGRNGLFTSHLLKALKKAHQSCQRVDDMFMEVSNAVMRESGERQEPWQHVSLIEPVYFGSCHIRPPPRPVPTQPATIFRDRLQDGSQGPEMVVIPTGRFKMGDIQGGGDSNEKPVHQVSVAQFAISRYEVTVSEYLRFVQATGRHAPEWQKAGSKYNIQTGTRSYYYKILGSALTKENYPIVGVSWYNAVAYADWLSQQTGKPYRLPTEAEWEYAARAGKKTKYWWGNEIGSKNANCSNRDCGDDFKYTAPVETFASNPFKLYNTVGNVWEWTCSEYEDKYSGKEQQCKGDAKGRRFVLRGGSWDNGARGVRSANRVWRIPSERGVGIGFRVAKDYK